MAGISYRAAQITDLDEVADVQVASQSALHQQIYSADSRPLPRARDWPAWLENRPPFARANCPKRIELALRDGSVIGFAAVRHGSNFEGFGADLTGLFILPEFQRRGIGRMLLRRAAEWLHPSGVEGLAVDVVAANPACRFYECLEGSVIAEWLVVVQFG